VRSVPRGSESAWLSRIGFPAIPSIVHRFRQIADLLLTRPQAFQWSECSDATSTAPRRGAPSRVGLAPISKSVQLSGRGNDSRNAAPGKSSARGASRANRESM